MLYVYRDGLSVVITLSPQLDEVVVVAETNDSVAIAAIAVVMNVGISALAKE